MCALFTEFITFWTHLLKKKKTICLQTRSTCKMWKQTNMGKECLNVYEYIFRGDIILKSVKKLLIVLIIVKFKTFKLVFVAFKLKTGIIL